MASGYDYMSDQILDLVDMGVDAVKSRWNRGKNWETGDTVWLKHPVDSEVVVCGVVADVGTKISERCEGCEFAGEGCVECEAIEEFTLVVCIHSELNPDLDEDDIDGYFGGFEVPVYAVHANKSDVE